MIRNTRALARLLVGGICHPRPAPAHWLGLVHLALTLHVIGLLFDAQVTAQQAASGAASLSEARVASSAAPAALRGFQASSSTPYAAAEPAAAVAPAAVKEPEPEEPALTQAELTPRQVVEMLDRYIVGQDAAKKAVANALRNRWRRHKVPSPLRVRGVA